MVKGTEFLPVSRDEMIHRGWYYYDFLVVTADGYIDHPSFGSAIIARLLESEGYRVAVLAQPDWHDAEAFRAMGKPRYGVMIGGGNLDSMVAHYTVAKRRRTQDLYSPGGKLGFRPDRPTIVYANRAKEAFPDTPIIIGGLEASLRRFAHYDYWDDKVRRSILFDAPADLLVYGMGEYATIEIAKALSVNAKVLILDEPTASLSEKETAHLFTLINSLKQRGVSMIYISHRMAEIFKICDTITVLRNGSIVTTKPTRDYSLTGLIEDMIGRKTAALTTADEELASKCTGRPLMTVEHLNCGSRLKDVSFELREGEVLGLAGLMGSGRTEVVESLFGLNKDASGQVTINGQSYEIKGVRHAIDSGLALIPEDRRREGLVLMHSVEENLIVPIFDKLKRGLLLENKKVADIAERSISDMAIKTHSRKTPAFNLSGGNQQKIVVGKWLNSAPSVLLLDEPTAGVDVGSKREIIDKVRDFVGENRAAIFISSDILELISACDRFIVFYDGKVTATYNRSEITEEVLQYAIQNEC